MGIRNNTFNQPGLDFEDLYQRIVTRLGSLQGGGSVVSYSNTQDTDAAGNVLASNADGHVNLDALGVNLGAGNYPPTTETAISILEKSILGSRTSAVSDVSFAQFRNVTTNQTVIDIGLTDNSIGAGQIKIADENGIDRIFLVGDQEESRFIAHTASGNERVLSVYNTGNSLLASIGKTSEGGRFLNYNDQGAIRGVWSVTTTDHGLFSLEDSEDETAIVFRTDATPSYMKAFNNGIDVLSILDADQNDRIKLGVEGNGGGRAEWMQNDGTYGVRIEGSNSTNQGYIYLSTDVGSQHGLSGQNRQSATVNSGYFIRSVDVSNNFVWGITWDGQMQGLQFEDSLFFSNTQDANAAGKPLDSNGSGQLNLTSLGINLGAGNYPPTFNVGISILDKYLYVERGVTATDQHYVQLQNNTDNVDVIRLSHSANQGHGKITILDNMELEMLVFDVSNSAGRFQLLNTDSDTHVLFSGSSSETSRLVAHATAGTETYLAFRNSLDSTNYLDIQRDTSGGLINVRDTTGAINSILKANSAGGSLELLTQSGNTTSLLSSTGTGGLLQLNTTGGAVRNEFGVFANSGYFNQRDSSGTIHIELRSDSTPSSFRAQGLNQEVLQIRNTSNTPLLKHLIRTDNTITTFWNRLDGIAGVLIDSNASSGVAYQRIRTDDGTKTGLLFYNDEGTATGSGYAIESQDSSGAHVWGITWNGQLSGLAASNQHDRQHNITSTADHIFSGATGQVFTMTGTGVANWADLPTVTYYSDGESNPNLPLKSDASGKLNLDAISINNGGILASSTIGIFVENKEITVDRTTSQVAFRLRNQSDNSDKAIFGINSLNHGYLNLYNSLGQVSAQLFSATNNDGILQLLDASAGQAQVQLNGSTTSYFRGVSGLVNILDVRNNTNSPIVQMGLQSSVNDRGSVKVMETDGSTLGWMYGDQNGGVVRTFNSNGTNGIIIAQTPSDYAWINMYDNANNIRVQIRSDDSESFFRANSNNTYIFTLRNSSSTGVIEDFIRSNGAGSTLWRSASGHAGVIIDGDAQIGNAEHLRIWTLDGSRTGIRMLNNESGSDDSGYAIASYTSGGSFRWGIRWDGVVNGLTEFIDAVEAWSNVTVEKAGWVNNGLGNANVTGYGPMQHRRDATLTQVQLHGYIWSNGTGGGISSGDVIASVPYTFPEDKFVVAAFFNSTGVLQGAAQGIRVETNGDLVSLAQNTGTHYVMISGTVALT